MSKQIKDYLHLYIGCDFVTTNSQGNVNLSTISLICKYYDKFQLVLRPLSDMTIVEAYDIAHICNGSQYIEPIVYNVSYRPTIRDGKNILCIDWEAFEVIKHTGDKPKKLLLHVCSWGTITKYVDGQLGTENKAILIVKYLLSKGFDLFGLIEEGLAIGYYTKSTYLG